MHIVNDICYADSEATEIKVKEAKALKGGILLVTFSNEEKRLFDTTKLTGNAFKPLEKDEVFNNIQIFHGIITWNDGEIDIAPETVYADSYPYENII